MKNPPVVTPLEVRYADLDPYGHVNNAVHLQFLEQVRMAYWKALAKEAGIAEGDLVAGDVPGARYVIAETTLRYKAPIFLEDELHGAASVSRVGNRSYTMLFELRAGETFEDGVVALEAVTAHVFFDPVEDAVKPRPDWFLPAVAALEGRPEHELTGGEPA